MINLKEIMLISENPNDVQEFRGLEYEGNEILKTLGCVIGNHKVKGWNCIMGNVEIVLIPKSFFEKHFNKRIIVGVE